MLYEVITDQFTNFILVSWLSLISSWRLDKGRGTKRSKTVLRQCTDLLAKNGRPKLHLGREKLATKIWPVHFLFIFRRGTDSGRQLWHPIFVPQNWRPKRAPRFPESQFFDQASIQKNWVHHLQAVRLLSPATPYSLIVFATAFFV